MVDLPWLVEALHADSVPGSTLQRRLYRALHAAVAAGHVQAGAVLPSSRGLAQALGVSRNTVLAAYSQLAGEGYVEASRQGTVVTAWRGARTATTPSAERGALRFSRRSQGLISPVRQADDMQRPFQPGHPALDAFPWGLWQRLCWRMSRELTARDLGYRDPAGEWELRQAIATYLRAARGVPCDAQQVVVTDGTQSSLHWVISMLTDPGDTAWIEHPGYGGAWSALRQAGLRCHPVAVDTQGLAPQPQDWAQQPPRLIYTTPSHQYPTGAVMSLPRRQALLEQAQAAGAWVLEDDYDSEFRQHGPVLTALQGLQDATSVLYMGTFSKTMFPGLRMAYVVLPKACLADGLASANSWGRWGRVIEQRALAAFIQEGHYARHLQRMRRLYAQRQADLHQHLARYWPWPVVCEGGHCGMHVVLRLPAGLDDQALAHAVNREGLGARALSAYATGGAVTDLSGLVLGYAHVSAEHMGACVRVLAQAAQYLAVH